MKLAHCFCLLLWMLPLSGAAQTRDDTAPGLEDRKAIREVIGRQIEAFRQDDEAAAFSYASPGIQHQFGTPKNFMVMVRQGYPAVYRPRAIKFLDLSVIDGQLIQAVQFTGSDGKIVVALYAMQRQSDHTWKVDGCQIAPSRSMSI